MAKLIAGSGHVTPEIQDLEKRLMGSFGTNRFASAYASHIYEFLQPGQVITFDDLKRADAFVRQWFYGKLPEMELWLVRGFVLGHLLQRGETVPGRKAIDIETLPGTIRAAAKEYGLTSNQVNQLRWNLGHGAEHLTNTTNDTASRVQRVMFDNIKTGAGRRNLVRALEAEFSNDESEINRDWNLVAIHESNRAVNEAYLSGLPPGSYVMGLSMPDRCDACGELIDGKVYEVIDKPARTSFEGLEPESKQYNDLADLYESAVWVGKDNIGRSFSPHKRKDKSIGNTTGNLTARARHEMYVPCVPLHVRCRCRWVRIDPLRQYVDGNGAMRMAFENKEAHAAWYTNTIAPLG